MNKNKKEEEKARKEEKAEYDRYIRYESYCKELRDKNIALQDKIVITISSALFGIIITSLDKLLPLFDTFKKLNCFFILLVVVNALTICFFLVSIHFAKKGLKNSIDNARINYREKGEIGEIKVNQYTKYARRFQNIYLLLFAAVNVIFAIMLIYIF